MSTPATLPELLERYPDESACADFLASVRWPDGLRCECGGEGWHLEVRPRVWECHECGKQTSVTAGTLFDRCRELKNWMLAVWLLSVDDGCTAAHLQRLLGVHGETAWLMFHRVRQALDEIRPPLTGEVAAKIDRMDGASRWVRRYYPTLDPGDGPFVAVALSGNETRIQEVSRNRGSAILDVADQWLAKGAKLWLHHAPRYDLRRLGIEAPAIGREERVHLGVVSLVHQEIRKWLNLTFQGVSRRWLARYLHEYTWRENHPGERFDEMITRALALPPGLVWPPRPGSAPSPESDPGPEASGVHEVVTGPAATPC